MDLLCYMIEKHIILHHDFFFFWPITQWAALDSCRCGLPGKITEDWNLVWWNGRCMIRLRVLHKGTLVIELRPITTSKANPIHQAAMILQNRLSPSFLCIEKDMQLTAVGHNTGVKAHHLRCVSYYYY